MKERNTRKRWRAPLNANGLAKPNNRSNITQSATKHSYKRGCRSASIGLALILDGCRLFDMFECVRSDIQNANGASLTMHV
eukprot:5706325-Amphidinium_carterae.1